jgi:putative spermidine/putrescine transport system permease protein
LVIPLAAFMLVFFVLPIFLMLVRSVYETDVIEAFPEASRTIGTWDRQDPMPNEDVMRAVIADLRQSPPDSIGRAAKRLNYIVPGYLTLLLKSKERADSLTADPASARDWLFQADSRWRKPEYWAALANSATTFTSSYLLAAVDLRRDLQGNIGQAPEDSRIYRDVIERTFIISTVTTVICLLLAFPLSYLLAASGPKLRLILFVFVLLPFWTSVLVRSIAWVVLLQADGPVTSLVRSISPVLSQVELVHNRFGVYVAMVHTLLPFAVLPLYSVMVGIPRNLVRAASSLGAGPLRTFFRVYLPQTVPGLAAGGLLIFISALGYYITPALVGGARDQLISYYIALFVNKTVNWGMAAALSAVLIAIIAILGLLFRRLSRGGQYALP